MSWWYAFGYAVQAAAWLLAAWNRGAIGGRRDREQAAAAFARKSGLQDQDPPDDELVRRVVRRHRFGLAGAAIGFYAVAPLVTVNIWPSLALLYLGLATGAVLALLTAPRPAADSPRVAHATGTRLTDYVPPWIVAVLVAAAAVALGLVTVVAAAEAGSAVDRSGNPMIVQDGALPAAAVVAAGALVASLAAARVVAGRRRTVASAAGLAVDDALRASAVRDCLQISAAASAYVVIEASQLLGLQVFGEVGHVLQEWTPALALIAVVAVLLVFRSTHGAQRWRGRLHSGEMAA